MVVVCHRTHTPVVGAGVVGTVGVPNSCSVFFRHIPRVLGREVVGTVGVPVRGYLTSCLFQEGVYPRRLEECPVGFFLLFLPTLLEGLLLVPFMDHQFCWRCFSWCVRPSKEE